ncbi:MAG TPA: HEAT repeat domain-containing protein [Isosphaeraceae bacterium]
MAREDPRPEVPPALREALSGVEFKGLPQELLKDRRAVARQLKALAEQPHATLDAAEGLVRGRAIVALGMYGGPDALGTLKALAEAEGEPYRRHALVGIGRTRAPEGVSTAAKFLAHDDVLLREAAIDSLAASGLPQALAALERFDASEDEGYIRRKRQAAIAALTARLRRPGADPPGEDREDR